MRAVAVLCVVPEPGGGAAARERARALVAGFRSIYCDPGFWRIAGVSMTVPAASLAYAIQTRRYDASLAGRVNTAVNLLGFLGAFAAQWGSASWSISGPPRRAPRPRRLPR